MAEFHQPPSEADLERRLITLGRQIEFPPTPALAQAVRHRLSNGTLLTVEIVSG